MTITEFFTLYFKIISTADLTSDIQGLLGILTPSQTNAVENTVKNRILAKLAADKAALESRASTSADSFSSGIANVDQQIADVTAVNLP